MGTNISTLSRERHKYARMWAFESYRINSPGEHAVGNLLNNVGWKPGDTLIDLGCGTGRAGLSFEERGFNVTLLDFCPSAPDRNTRHLLFINACIWNMETIPDRKYDWIYCADVLEHIPSEYMNAALDEMARVSRRGGYLQIACHGDGFGKLIGETLHMNIQSPDWWLRQVSHRWRVKDLTEDKDTAKFVIGEPNAI